MSRRLGWYLLMVTLSTGLGGWFGWRSVAGECRVLDRHGVDSGDCDLHPVRAIEWGLQALAVSVAVVMLVELVVVARRRAG